MRKYILLLPFIVVTHVCASNPNDQKRNDLDYNSKVEVTYRLPIFNQTRTISKRMSLKQAMRFYGAHAMSIALIDHNRIVWNEHFQYDLPKAYHLNNDSLFQCASMSKFITAALVMKLLESHKLSLDTQLNDYLIHWKIRNNGLTMHHHLPTIRNVLDMTSGFNYISFPGYDRNKKFPTLLDMLNGFPPAKNAAITVQNNVPGEQFHYSTGGYAVLQLAIENNMHNKSFSYLMKKYILQPLNMKRSTFSVSPTNYAPSYETNRKKLSDDYLVYPALAGEGLWSTSHDISNLLIAIMKSYQHNDFFKRNIIQEMLTKQSNTDYGLGPKINNYGESKLFYKFGGGSEYSDVLLGFPSSGKGVVIFTDTGSGEIILSLLPKLASMYQWPDDLKHISIF